VRPLRNPRWQKQGGWEVFEAEGVRPVYCDEWARESALSYARQRAGYGSCEIQVLDDAWNVAETISNKDSRPLVWAIDLLPFTLVIASTGRNIAYFCFGIGSDTVPVG
jgi:hypothetical protein